MADSLSITVEQLQKLEPLSTLSQERLEELISLSYVEKLSIGVSIFHEGDIDNQTVYLLDGDVHLTSSDQKVDKVISSNQTEAKYPLDDSQPRQVSCSALCRVELIRIDNSVLEYMMMWDQLAVSEESVPEVEEKKAEAAVPSSESEKISQVSEKVKSENTKPEKESKATKPKDVKQAQSSANESEDEPNPDMIPASDEDRSWIRKMRHIMAFKNMPPANIKALLEKMDTILVEKGDVVVEQGTDGEFYYVLTEGEAVVTRMVELARLSPGASFGEEALVAETKRNASITMSTDGMLMRLSKQNFSALLKDPLLERVSPDDARQQINKGAIWLDVRHAKEYAHSRLAKAINLPLHEVRLRLDELDKDKKYMLLQHRTSQQCHRIFVSAKWI